MLRNKDIGKSHSLSFPHIVKHDYEPKLDKYTKVNKSSNFFPESSKQNISDYFFA